MFVNPSPNAKDPKHQCSSVGDRLNKIRDYYSLINFHIMEYYEAPVKKEALVYPEVWNYLQRMLSVRNCVQIMYYNFIHIRVCVCVCV